MDEANTAHMRQNALQRSDGFYCRSTILHGIAFLSIAIALAMGAAYLEAEKLVSSFVPDQPLSQHMISYANLLLIASTFLYVVHLWVTAKAVGQLASGMATVGAMGVTVALLVRWFEASFLRQSGHTPLSTLYEVTALFSAVTVVIYLAMEKVYHTRAAGAFLMPIVVGAVLVESLLLSGEQRIPGHLVPELKSYWMHAHILSNFVGHGAFAIAASLGIMHLFRGRAEKRRMTEGFAMRSLPDFQRIDRLMFAAIAVGFCTYTLGEVLHVAWSYEESGKFLAWTRKEVSGLAVWSIYLTYFYGHYRHQWRGHRMAWLAIIGFVVSVLRFT